MISQEEQSEVGFRLAQTHATFPQTLAASDIVSQLPPPRLK